ncbi:MAG: hypothetical protein ACHQ49_10160 [Elusimicrobiota bacterium]
MNDDKNIFGRVLALALLIGAAYGVRSIAHGSFSCPLGDGSCCGMKHSEASSSAAEEAPPAKAGAEREDSEDEEAKLEAKAPVVPPAPKP